MKNLNLSMDILEQFLEGKNNFNYQGKPVEYNGGYMVALGGYETIITRNLKRPHTTTAHILNDISEKIDILKRINETEKNINMVIGFWEDDGKIYIDISRNIDDLEQAKKYGAHHEQKAIFDIKNKVSIYL
jgi:hypothetical protein